MNFKLTVENLGLTCKGSPKEKEIRTVDVKGILNEVWKEIKSVYLDTTYTTYT